MEGTFNLKTASEYINNLLLARGLLRDGKKIQFAHPSRGEGGKEVTMAQIINLVHDLILKRDRDQEQRESVAGTLRSLRSEATRQTLAMDKLQTRNEDLARQLSLAQSQERSARAALRTAETTARGLREEMARLKTTVQQVRTSCANDIRKRDVQMHRLKGHLTSQQRGNRTGLVGASITINPGLTGAGGMTTSVRDDGPDGEDAEYSLKQETTDFLTQLSQSLSDENDNLIGLVRTAITTLRELQGIPAEQREAHDLSTIREEEEITDHGMLHALPTSYEALASDLESCLDNVKHLLTNPNFVPLEEVESREEEILRLRAGWEKMETRLREAFALMETWRRRMANGGDTINLDELKMGLGLGFDLGTANKGDMSMTMEDDEEEEEEEEEEDGVSSVFDEEPDEEPDEQPDELPDEPIEPPSPEPSYLIGDACTSNIFRAKLQPNPQALKETNSNSKSPDRSPRKVAFSPSIPNTPTQPDENAAVPHPSLGEAQKATLVRPGPRTKEDDSRPSGQKVGCDASVTRACELAVQALFSPSSHSSSAAASSLVDAPTPLDDDDDDDDDDANVGSQAKKRLSNEVHPDEPSPKLTVQDKLKVAQAEAEAAAANVTIRSSPVKQDRVSREGESAVVEVRERRQRRASRSSPVKTRISGRPRRRKSTLTPEELDKLLGV